MPDHREADGNEANEPEQSEAVATEPDQRAAADSESLLWHTAQWLMGLFGFLSLATVFGSRRLSKGRARALDSWSVPQIATVTGLVTAICASNVFLSIGGLLVAGVSAGLATAVRRHR